MNKPQLPRKQGASKKLKDFWEFGPAKPAHSDKPKGLYYDHYQEALDQVINCIKERFNQEEFQKYAMLQEVPLKAGRKQPFNVELE